jgi:hypothetical protein
MFSRAVFSAIGPYAAALLIGLAAGWWLNGYRLGTQLATLQAEHATHLATQQAASADVISRTLLRERDLHNQLEEYEQNAQAEKERLARDLADSNAVARRMREKLDDISGRIGTDTGTAAECEAARVTSGLLAQLLGEADELAGIFAESADRSRIAGSVCEAAYGAARGL